MSTERERREFEQYLEYQRAQRHNRVETLGGVATVLFLSTIDMGLIGASDPLPEHTARHEPEALPDVESSPSRVAREHKLAQFAADNAELGYARAA